MACLSKHIPILKMQNRMEPICCILISWKDCLPKCASLKKRLTSCRRILNGVKLQVYKIATTMRKRSIISFVVLLLSAYGVQAQHMTAAENPIFNGERKFTAGI